MAQTGIQTVKQTGIQTVKQTGIQTVKQTGIKTVKQAKQCPMPQEHHVLRTLPTVC
jgi:hypothetical protein